MPSKFNPNDFGFFKSEYAIQGIEFYEQRVSFITSKKADFFRLNLYLSKSGDYINIWFGLLEPFVVQFEIDKIHLKLSAQEQYFEKLFAGYIETKAEGQVILKCLKLGRFSVPQQIQMNGRVVRCDILSKDLYSKIQNKE